jgi:hypothetical protein
MRISSCGVIFALACAAVAGCAATPTDADEDQVTQGITNTAAFTLTVSGNFFAGTSVTTTNVNDLCPSGSQCQFGFIGGSTLTIRPTETQDLIDCLRFSGWQGACAGQGSTCTVVINSNISVSQSRWTKISGCVPK